MRDLGVAYYSGITNGLLQGQISIPGQVVFSKIGVEGIPVYNVENACASGSSSFNLAVQSLKAGTTDVALALGAEKMNIPDKTKALAIFEGGWDVSQADENAATLVQLGAGITPPPGSESDRPYSKFMAIYAAMCRWHMKTYGTTQRQLAGCVPRITSTPCTILVAVPQALHDRGSARGAAHHLPAHAADVRAAL